MTERQIIKTSTTMESIEKEFAQLVREQKSTIYTVCYMFSNDEEEVNDLFQEALVNLWKGYESFRHESKVNTWVYRVTLNSCLSAERKKKRRIQAVPLTMDVNFYADSDADARQVRQLHERIQKLGMVDRAIVLMWLENMSYDEIAAVMGITPKNVGVKLFRIKQQLMKG
jgi:RNA polymerase sigma-70 factor (ECF subfamily)